MKHILSFIILSLLISTGCKEDQGGSELLDCWIESYEGDFNFEKELDILEEQLLEQNILKGRKVDDYNDLMRQLNNGTAKLDPLSRRGTVNGQPFLECREKHQKPMNAYGPKTMKYGILFSIYNQISK